VDRGLAAVASVPFVLGFLHDYTVLTASLAAYAVSTLVCYFMSVRSTQNFDFDLIKERIGDYDAAPEPTDVPATK
jgi:hypothetical protein